MALGEVDYGLYGVVGGLTAFIGFFNGILSGSISRFYAYSVGMAQKKGEEDVGLEECRRWFSVAVSVHTVVPVVLMSIGYPLGVYAVEHWLTIPADRVQDCVWVFRFVCTTCFLGMVSVPFNAMYGAKQLIAELTIYSFITSTLNVVEGLILLIVEQVVVLLQCFYLMVKLHLHLGHLLSYKIEYSLNLAFH